jgi:hypothetical protein
MDLGTEPGVRGSGGPAAAAASSARVRSVPSTKSGILAETLATLLLGIDIDIYYMKYARALRRLDFTKYSFTRMLNPLPPNYQRIGSFSFVFRL